MQTTKAFLGGAGVGVGVVFRGGLYIKIILKCTQSFIKIKHHFSEVLVWKGYHAEDILFIAGTPRR